MMILTGGAGFIGSCVLTRLNQKGFKDIWVVDHLEPSDQFKKRNLENKSYSQYLDKDEFLKLVRSDQLVDPVEALIHMGACSSTTLPDERYFHINNFEYSRTLAQWAVNHQVPFIYASSAATYGNGAHGYSDDHDLIHRLRPLNYYGESKQKMDEWVLEHDLIHRIVGLKFFNVFGPNEYHKGEMRSVVAKAFDRVEKEGKLDLFKSYKREYQNGEQKRDFIYIQDAVDIVLYFLDHPQIHGIFNVGTGLARTWNDLARALFSAVDKKPFIEYIDMPEILKTQYQYFTQADITKLKDSGYQKPFLTLEEAVKDYAGYLRTQRHW